MGTADYMITPVNAEDPQYMIYIVAGIDRVGWVTSEDILMLGVSLDFRKAYKMYETSAMLLQRNLEQLGVACIICTENTIVPRTQEKGGRE